MRTSRKRAFSLIELLFVIAIISLLAALLFPVFERARDQVRGTVCLSNMHQVGLSLSLYLQDYDETYPMNRFPDEAHPDGKCAVDVSSYPISTSEESRINWRRVVQPYIKNQQVTICPSNPYATSPIAPNIPWGDQTNHYYALKDYLPLSYAYNGSFFHEAVPSCFYKEPKDRPRSEAEISAPSGLILLLESRLPNPDIGSWFLSFGTFPNGLGYFQSHNGQVNLLFADLHAKRRKLAATCTGKMWTDTYLDGSDACQNLDQLPEEYK